MILYRGQRRAVIEGTPANRTHILLPGIKDLGFPAREVGRAGKGAPQGQPAK